MPNATPDGRITTPDETASNDMEAWLLDLATQVSDLIPHIAIGALQVNVSNSASAAGTVNFPVGRFASTPIVMMTSRDSSYIVTTGTGSAASIPFTVRHVDNIVTTATVAGANMALTY